MRELAKYSFANAKIRAMLSRILDSTTLQQLRRVKDIYELVDSLTQTHYQEVLRSIDWGNFDITDLERRLIRYAIARFRRVYTAINGSVEKVLVNLLLQRYELEELKVILRIWHKKLSVNIEDYLIGEDLGAHLQPHKLLACASLEEIIVLLDETPYKKPLINARNNYKVHNSIFYIEAALDVDYYRRLWQCVDKLSNNDKIIARNILAVVVDIENIHWLIRMRKYYSMGIGEMLEGILPGGAWITKERLSQVYASDGLGKVIESISLGPYAQLKSLVEENITFLEGFLFDFLQQKIRQAMSGFPFTIGTVLGYLLLMQKETQAVISLLNAKVLGLASEETEYIVRI
ncbi:MAG: V-type ATPase subunit [Candidatus Omnitrophica bacterium]|nr:V-type ATPase subunit [Candidatus Omnitrophota bacterium]